MRVYCRTCQMTLEVDRFSTSIVYCRKCSTCIGRFVECKNKRLPPGDLTQEQLKAFLCDKKFFVYSSAALEKDDVCDFCKPSTFVKSICVRCRVGFQTKKQINRCQCCHAEYILTK